MARLEMVDGKLYHEQCLMRIATNDSPILKDLIERDKRSNSY